MTRITLGDYLISELMELKEGERIQVYDDNGTEGYLEKDSEGSIVINGRHFIFYYYQPRNIEVYKYTKGFERKRIA